MKMLILISLLSISAAQAKTLNCDVTLDPNNSPGSLQSIHLEGQLYQDDQGQVHADLLKNAKAITTEITYEGKNSTLTGRSLDFYPDKKYKGTKYTNHKRFDLSLLTETENFGHFYPSDSCQIQVIMPNEGFQKASFDAPTLIHCDQSGGRTTLACTLK